MLQKWERDVSEDIQVTVFIWQASKGIVGDPEGPGMENKLNFGF